MRNETFDAVCVATQQAGRADACGARAVTRPQRKADEERVIELQYFHRWRSAADGDRPRSGTSGLEQLRLLVGPTAPFA